MSADFPDGPAARPVGLHHVRLTVTDIGRSRAFYRNVFGSGDPDFTDQAADPAARSDPYRLFAGCLFAFGGQLLACGQARRRRPLQPGTGRTRSSQPGRQLA